jgi:glutamate--cysteine ligase
MSRLTREALRADLAAHAFGAPPSASLTPRRVGAETEFIPIETATSRRCPIDGDGCCATLPFLRRHGARQGWTETRTAKGTPCFSLPEGGTITFEPGGQIEYSSPPCRSPSALLAMLRAVVLPLRSAAAGDGITLLAVGIDPANDIEGAPLFLRTRRYERMAEYLATRGPDGARMMRQTAAFQVALDLDDEPWLRWRVLNAAAPYVVAMFANSPTYAGRSTGCASTRSQVWRALDPARTGLPWSERAPLDAYLDFALDAPALLLPTAGGHCLRFGDWLARAGVTHDEWHDHLSTLFPEVRPRGHFELRSADAVAPQWYAAPLALAVGITYEPRALRAAADLLGPPDLGLLDRAGRLGLRDARIASRAADLAGIALQGCQGLGPGYFHPADLEQARTFFERYTFRALSPADELSSAEAAA